MTQISQQILMSAVASLCPDIMERVDESEGRIDERQLWWELSCCITSSQVPYQLALGAADAIQSSRLLLEGNTSENGMASELALILRQPLSFGNGFRKFRFPALRARQLSATHAAVIESAGSLHALVSKSDDALIVRKWFVENAPGLGPKQASMFLRNARISYDLAVLDRHVLRYMSALGISNGRNGPIASFADYRNRENALCDHAKYLGYPVGILDWAIWIVMRAASKQQMELPIQ